MVDILHDLLKYFKKSTSESAIELSVAKQGYNAIHTAAIGGNAAWTNLQTLHLKYNSIGDEGVACLSKNTSWICFGNVEALLVWVIVSFRLCEIYFPLLRPSWPVGSSWFIGLKVAMSFTLLTKNCFKYTYAK